MSSIVTDGNSRGDVLITGGDDFLVEYLYREFAGHAPDDINVLTLGTAGNVDIVADLRGEVPHISRRIDTVVHVDGSDRRRRDAAVDVSAAEGLCRMLEGNVPGRMVYVSSVAVYGRESGETYTEDTPTVPRDDYGRSKLAVEQLLADWCAARGVTLTVLRPALTVGTGMGGELRQMVNSIYRGTYRHIKDDATRRSVVHAVDVARAARVAAPHGGVYNLTDGADPTVHDIAEALAYRLDNKRIYTVSMRQARRWAAVGDWIPLLSMDRETLRCRTTTLTFDSSLFRSRFDFTPNTVTEYLHKHNYDENSL